MASRIWKDGTRRGIAYVEDREQAEQILTLVGRRRETSVRQKTAESLLGPAMAVYSDRKGRPFAWQIPFDITRWDEIQAVLTAA